ncbi:glycine zipper 2TM domain-containing protein [[Haemophilus] ducreyi]|uniref:glycine zipper 2TM domain-containing protein n=1 Tax=Haemophilus ducreyi TaxID=730 RepID=UPI000655F3C5|nr:glycine zipper 2TM domain-containing protein [[Haemophilus] ducreyi]AKO44892.1 membrane protein [[Haemophilus] ducreyi]AKO46298.1 membrane protein [[Haemophilus] ducreyi]AKO47641.1 membrane protein [[Haemophilus] ducreyi]AKO49022.1 membrane protein [[Haemophilus] ducreyi]ANF61792.1 hypothetical protein A6037_03040 [[Haemophilus] ducreyi]
MKKCSLAAALMSSLILSGCANTDIFSGSVYSAEQAKEARAISYGTIVSIREVKIQAQTADEGLLGAVGGGVLGGVAGSAIGGGTGRALSTAVGAVAGAVIGNTVEQKANQVTSLEIVIRKDNGQEIVVVQKKEAGFLPGKRVRIVGSNASLNVSLL